MCGFCQFGVFQLYKCHVYVWLCMAVYGYVWLCRAMYGYVGRIDRSWVTKYCHNRATVSQNISTFLLWNVRYNVRNILRKIKAWAPKWFSQKKMGVVYLWHLSTRKMRLCQIHVWFLSIWCFPIIQMLSRDSILSENNKKSYNKNGNTCCCEL